MWFLFQSVIVFAVMASNIHFKWTPNSFVASLLGGVLALIATHFLNELLTWTRKQRRQ